MKRFKKFLKFLVVGIIWSYAFLLLANTFMIQVWKFDLTSANHWQVISSFWDKGGSIKSAKDYYFILSLIAIPIIWLFIYRLLYKTNFITLLLFPIHLINRWSLRKYSDSNQSRVIIKNIGSKKIDIEEVIAKKMAQNSQSQKIEPHDIRKDIQSKIGNIKK